MRSLNEWYDALPEPRRFLLFFAFVAIPMNIAIVWYPPAALALGAVFAVGRLWHWH